MAVYENLQGAGYGDVETGWIMAMMYIASWTPYLGFDDAFHEHAAIDGHVQSDSERRWKFGVATVETALAATPYTILSKGPFDDVAKHIDDFNTNPNNWNVISSHIGKSTRKGGRRIGVSTQTIYRNPASGKSMVQHIVSNDKGQIVDRHWREIYKPRIGDLFDGS
jgi:hypothetical protein